MSLCKKQFSQERTINIAIIGFVYSIIFNLETHHVSHVFCTKKRVPSPQTKIPPKKKGYSTDILYTADFPQKNASQRKPQHNDHRESPRPLKRRPRQSLPCRRPRRKQTKAPHLRRPSHAGGAIRQSSNVENPWTTWMWVKMEDLGDHRC